MRKHLKQYGVGYLVAVAVTAAAVLLRWLLDPLMGDTLPLVTLFGAVAAAVWVGGYRPALLAAVLGYLACDYLFIQPRGALGFNDVRNLVGLLAYLLTCSFIIGFGEAMRVAQRRLAEQRERLRTTLASIGDAVISTDTDGRITNMNSMAESLTGWKKEEATGQQLDTVFRIVNEKTRQPAPNPAIRAITEGVIVGLANHTVLIAKDGTERPIDDSASPIRCKEGEIVGCVLVFRDVTERRGVEQQVADDAARIESIVNHVIDGIIAIDESGTVEAFNPAAERLFGYRAEEVIGQNVKLLMPEPFHSEHDGYLANYLRTGQAKIIGIGREVAGRRKDDSTFPMDLAVSEFLLGKRRYFTGIVRDISERKQAEIALKERAADVAVALGKRTEEARRAEKAEQQLREADRRKNEFLATLAHELRNPLAPIRNAVEILRVKGSPDPDVQWSQEVIDRQVQYMARLLDDLLDVSRITHGKLELRKERVELAAVVQSAVETARPLIDSHGQKLTVALPHQPVYLDADPVRLAQVLSNLLNNAAKYSESGSHIGLTCERQGSDVVVSVKDDGMGIAAEMMPRLFDIFSQSKRVLERSQGGLGIGLSLVRGLVELHGGRVEARSEGPGKGSEFLVHLPILVEQPTVTTPEPTPEPTMMSRRILLVDDNVDTARTLAMLLTMSGNEIQVAHDGFGAVEIAAEFRPDVVLLDIGLPTLSGYDACRRIREQPWGKNMVIVALTGWGQDDDRRKSKDAGFDHHMVKPVKLDDLEKVLASSRAEHS